LCLQIERETEREGQNHGEGNLYSRNPTVAGAPERFRIAFHFKLFDYIGASHLRLQKIEESEPEGQNKVSIKAHPISGIEALYIPSFPLFCLHSFLLLFSSDHRSRGLCFYLFFSKREQSFKAFR